MKQLFDDDEICVKLRHKKLIVPLDDRQKICHDAYLCSKVGQEVIHIRDGIVDTPQN